MISLSALFGRRTDAHTPIDIRHLARTPDLVYAIGDVHGCLEQLQELEELIVQDRNAMGLEAVIVMLGDYVDRGPQSAQTLDHLIALPPENFSRICLMGNHEYIMSQFLAGTEGGNRWLEFGGHETLSSYGISQDQMSELSNARQRNQLIASHVPSEHTDFLRKLPHALELPHHIFVHAGVRPGIKLAEQSQRDLLWIRDDFVGYPGPLDKFIVHGHTPVTVAENAGWRLNMDTGAYATGKLSAAKFVAGDLVEFFST